VADKIHDSVPNPMRSGPLAPLFIPRLPPAPADTVYR
jgi:hypothetical protein